MKVVLAGGSGQVGSMLARAFHRDSHEVVVLSRIASPAPWRVVAWDGKHAGDWVKDLDGADVVINLTGRSVNCRYHDRNRAEIMESRLNSVRAIGEAINTVDHPPATFFDHIILF